MVDVIRDIGAVLIKDLRIELRAREILFSMFLFAVLIIVICAFAFLSQPELTRSVAPGISWVALTFAGTLGLNRIASRELEGDCLTGLLLAPASRTAIFFGKAASCLVFLLAMELLLVPLTAILFDLDLTPQLGRHLLSILLGCLGFAALGTLFSIMLQNARLREVLLPLVFYPLVAPLLIAGVKVTGALLADDLGSAATWLKIQVVFDAVFVPAAAWAFRWTVGE